MGKATDFPPTPVRHTAETGSTNTDAKAAFAAGEDGPLWLTTDRQTAGVGRRGRPWQHISGNFAGTYLWSISREQSRHPAAFSFMAALAVKDASEAVGVMPGRLAFKWPNDVLAAGAKLAGLLPEMVTQGDRHGVLIGIGVNIASAPDVGAYATTSLTTLSRKPTKVEDFHAALDQSLQRWWASFRAEGFVPIRDAWLKEAAGLGAPLVATQEGQKISGIFTGLDENGALLLQGETQVHTITAADIFFPGKIR
ncbi:MAG: biotin--[acetyl-CoA-carboxylase] ligase [Pseudomonadota bacterium]